MRDDLTSMQKAFIDHSDKSGQGFDEMMQNEVAPSLGAYGTVFAVVDKPPVIPVNRADEERVGIPYLTVLSPFQVIDFEWSEDGSLNWFQYAVRKEEPRDPSKARARVNVDDFTEVVTWTRDEFITTKGSKETGRMPNPFGFVPVIVQAQFIDANRTIGKSSFFTSSRYIFAGNNLLHAGNYEIFKQVSALLLMQAQDLTDEESIKPVDEDTGLKKLEHRVKEQSRILPYQDPKAKPEYIVRNTDVVALAKEGADSYFIRAAENEKSAMSIQAAKQPESGISKAYSFLDVDWVLSEFAKALEGFERQALEIVARMTGSPGHEFTVSYPSEFDVRDFNARVDFVKGLQGINFPSETGIRSAMKAITPEITDDAGEQQAINNEIDTTPALPDNQGEQDGTDGTGNRAGGE
jgi:hypothetical protein